MRKEGGKLNLYNLEKEKALEEHDKVTLHRSNINEGRELFIVSEDGKTEELPHTKTEKRNHDGWYSKRPGGVSDVRTTAPILKIGEIYVGIRNCQMAP